MTGAQDPGPSGMSGNHPDMSSVPTLRSPPATTITHFPNIFDDEPEPGLLPSFLSKVKNTFTSAAPIVYPPKPEKPLSPPPNAVQKTEAQALAEAVRGRTEARHQPSRQDSRSPSTKSNKASLMPPPSLIPSNHSSAPSVASSHSRQSAQPVERLWRPSGVAPAQVVLTPASRVTTVVQATGTVISPETTARTPPAHRINPGFHAHRNSISSQAMRRRASIATIPDSPTSVSLAALIAANNELSLNPSSVPGFPIDDTKSVRSLAFKKNSVTRLIRRMRGEGLSKHYWMADEHCKECYECKSAFTVWRRKHHCRICGQIFCGRCASNIIGARRFGQEGGVRVCNLCLKIMEEYKDDVDDDDRRSINSVATSARLPSISDRFFDASPDYAQSPFAASQLFTSNPGESLQAIEEGVPADWYDRPYSPEYEDDMWNRPNTAAPFRRPVDEDAQSDVSIASELEPVSPPDERPRKVAFPRMDTMSTDGEGDRVPLTRVDSIPLRSRLSSRLSQGGLTALIDSEQKEGLWRARSHSFAQRPERLSGASLAHFNLMLEQAIARAGLAQPAEWHRVLGSLLRQVSTSLSPNVRAGDSIDVRAYVKIKKVPGGVISDSEYVDGIVISKNVAHKAMPRRLVNPRIMVVTFPIDYHRVENQFMSLDPILAQEKDYLRLLVGRIVDVRPHIVLVERSVSRIALDYLLDANIAVARSVKLSAIHQVARCTQADVVASMDRLALEPRLGRCAEFRIQSFEHELIPGRRKTLMRFEGCHRDYGCTLILRGADMDTLRKVKVITDFMALVACHLKNEVVLYNDEHNSIPPPTAIRPAFQQLLDSLSLESPASPGERQQERADALEQTQDIARSIEPYVKTALSSSASIRFPPPAPLTRMAELDLKLAALRRYRDEEEAAQILQEETKAVEPELNNEKAARDPYRVLRMPTEVARESALTLAEHEHAEQLHVWQSYVRRDDVVLRPEDFQGIVYLYSLSTEGREKPCVEPTLEAINFYQPVDQTLGQFLENLMADAAKPCPNETCDRLLLFHYSLLVHGDRRLQIAMDQFPCPSPGHEDRIITWSYCRQCAVPSPTTIIREETWKMSWGSYLEHCFYPPEASAGFNCPHDAYRDQIRYFAHRNLAVRIHNEQIDLYEPCRPSIRLQIKHETKVVLKNKEYESALQKNTAFFDSVLFRLRSFNYEVIQPEKVSLFKVALESMLARAVADREEMVNLLNSTYKLTPMTDVLALNTVLKTLQDKVVQWDHDFSEIEKTFMPSEKDLKKMTATHLRRLFANQDFSTLDRAGTITVSEADEKETKSIDEEAQGAEQLAPTEQPILHENITETPDGTPMGLEAPVPNPLESRDYNSDSTIGPNSSLKPPKEFIESSGVDSDVFISRIPRRSRPTPTVADMIKRFQQDAQGPFESLEPPSMTRTRSTGSVRRRQAEQESDSDVVSFSRPKLRRGRTEQGPSRHRDIPKDAGYATNASRVQPKVESVDKRKSRPPSRAPSGRTSPLPTSRAMEKRPQKGRVSRQSDSGSGSSTFIRPTKRVIGTSRVTSIAKHFDRLSREADRERARRNAAVRGKRARPVGATKAKVQVFENVRDAFRDESDSESSKADNEEDLGSDDSAESAPNRLPRKSSSSSKPSEITPLEASPPQEESHGIPIDAPPSAINTSSELSFTDRLQIELPSFETSAPLPSVPATPQPADEEESKTGEVSQVSQLSEGEMSSGGERSSILKTLTGLWAFRAGDYTPLEYPFSAAEHLFTDSRLIIRENEPTSIIAFTLSSKTYRDKMRSRFDSPDEDVSETEADDPSRGMHLNYDFEAGGSTIFCRIFFAERFATLRAACECEDSFVESLARCVQFDASGGKSGSAFLKTKDDRFIAKEISRLEMDALTKFAPAYFEYMRNAIREQRPTVLAKIYGFFKIGYRNAITGRVMRMNVLVMENLFYERRFSKIYDLKGSTRNRLIQPTGRVNEVLLDENLMELVYKHPLYLREHSKKILRSALYNDSLFLSNLNVMDYSLVVGVDTERRELVVGIVDYIRTFTWDKKLESWVKDTTFLGGTGKEPTIVTPKQYKTRFRTAMEKFYFVAVPDRWSKVKQEDLPVEEEKVV